MLFVLLKSNNDLPGWLAGQIGTELDYSEYWFRLNDARLFSSFEKMDFKQIKKLLEEATLQTIMQAKLRSDPPGGVWLPPILSSI